jgi:hypothetical protein
LASAILRLSALAAHRLLRAEAAGLLALLLSKFALLALLDRRLLNVLAFGLAELILITFFSHSDHSLHVAPAMLSSLNKDGA